MERKEACRKDKVGERQGDINRWMRNGRTDHGTVRDEPDGEGESNRATYE